MNRRDSAAGSRSGSAAHQSTSWATRSPRVPDGPGAAELASSGDPDGVMGELLAGLQEYAVFALDPGGRITGWNAGSVRMMGHTPQEIIGTDFALFFPPELVAVGVPNRSLERAASLGSHTEEGWRLRKDGQWYWAHVVTVAQHDPAGELTGFVKIVRDDTDSHTRLERSIRQFADFFALTPVGSGLFDSTGHVLDANIALAELLGYTQDQLHEMTLADLEPDAGADEPSILESLSDDSETGRTRLPLRRLVRFDGTIVVCDLHLARSVRATGSAFWLILFQDVTARQRQIEELQYWARHDELTGLPNRAAVDDLLGGVDLSRVAFLYCDLDNFKRINDSLGHAAGDELLVMLARRLRAQLPQDWSVVRSAGDEYVVICPDVPAAGGIEAVGDTVTKLMHASIPLRGQSVHVTASVGIAMPSERATNGEDLIRFASAALYEAKRAESGVAMAGPELIYAVDRQLQVEQQLREAIDSDALELHYQPVVAADGSLLGAEALVRWQHPDRGMLAPDAFLPVAEQGDLLHELDRWVLRRALCDAATWPAVDGRRPSVAVNLAALLPGDRDFVGTVGEVVAEAGIEWDRVVLELVETYLVDIPAATREAMDVLSARGVRFAVDDFGTGYSSMARLKEFPAQVIKADRQFVNGIDTSPSDFAVVRAIADMARAMNCTCIAEGVETVSQFTLLRGVGIDAYQGWLFSHAVPVAELREIARRGRIDLPDADRGR